MVRVLPHVKRLLVKSSKDLLHQSVSCEAPYLCSPTSRQDGGPRVGRCLLRPPRASRDDPSRFKIEFLAFSRSISWLLGGITKGGQTHSVSVRAHVILNKTTSQHHVLAIRRPTLGVWWTPFRDRASGPAAPFFQMFSRCPPCFAPWSAEFSIGRRTEGLGQPASVVPSPIGYRRRPRETWFFLSFSTASLRLG